MTNYELEEIYNQTVEDIKLGGYENVDGGWIDFDTHNLINGSRFIKSIPRQESDLVFPETKVYVQNLDSFQKAREMGPGCLVLNMASFYSAGGGVEFGAKAQEEELCRRSNLLLSLYKYSTHKYSTFDYDAPKKFKYPISEFGGIYSPDVTVYKSYLSYSPLDEPFTCSVATVPAVKNPELDKKTGMLTEKFATIMSGKIRTIFRIALKYGHHKLVLGAFGCGAYCNPPQHVARLFKEVMEEKEFVGHFSEICFAIIEYANSLRGNRIGNIKPFKEVFKD